MISFLAKLNAVKVNVLKTWNELASKICLLDESKKELAEEWLWNYEEIIDLS